MRIAATGIVTNQYNDILLIRRDDTLTWSAPGGSLEAGELPTDGVAREVKEETGMYVLPVRLVSTSFWPERPHPHLHLTFRCLIRGGEPTPSAESLQVGFFKSRTLPRPMLKPHRERVERARYHTGPAVWYVDSLRWYTKFMQSMLKVAAQPWRKWWAAVDRNQEPAADPPPKAPFWSARAYVVIANEAGHLLWLDAGNGQLALPGGAIGEQEAPWDAVVRLTEIQTGLQVRPGRLSGIYVRPRSTEMTFVFAATPLADHSVNGSARFAPPSAAGRPFAPLVEDSLAQLEETTIRYWTEFDPAG